MLVQTLSKPYLEITLPKFEQGPTCSTPLQNPTAVEERQHIPSLKKKTSMTVPFILTRLIKIWTKTTRFFIQVVKPIISLLFKLHIFGGSYVYGPLFY